MTFQEIIDICKAEAIANKLHPTDEAVWRSYCREYSRTFFTPLSDVLKMEPRDVIIHILEEQFENVSLEENMEQFLDMIYSLEDPDYARTKRDELKSFIKEAEEEEERRLEEGRPIHKSLAQDDEVSLRNAVPKQPPTPKQKLPQSGGINMSYLEKENNDDVGEDL